MKKRVVAILISGVVLLAPAYSAFAGHIHDYKNHTYVGSSFVMSTTEHDHLSYYLKGVPVTYPCIIQTHGINCCYTCDCGAKYPDTHTHSLGATHHRK